MDREELTEEELSERVQAILDSDDDESVKIGQLHDLGYSNTQIHQDFGFKKSTVYKVCPVRPVKRGNDKPLEVRKPGYALMKIGSKDMIPPEQALRDIRLQDGDYKLGFVDGMGLLIMAARYNQLLAAGQAEVLSNQLKIMEESRKGSAEVAQEAAMRAAAGVGAQIMPEVEALKTQLAASGENPMATMMTTLMMPSFQKAGQQMAQLFMKTRPGVQPEQPVQPETESGQQPPPPGNLPNVEEHSRAEFEEE